MSIKDFAFRPDTLTVHAGETVTVENDDSTTHSMSRKTTRVLRCRQPRRGQFQNLHCTEARHLQVPLQLPRQHARNLHHVHLGETTDRIREVGVVAASPRAHTGLAEGGRVQVRDNSE